MGMSCGGFCGKVTWILSSKNDSAARRRILMLLKNSIVCLVCVWVGIFKRIGDFGKSEILVFIKTLESSCSVQISSVQTGSWVCSGSRLTCTGDTRAIQNYRKLQHPLYWWFHTVHWFSWTCSVFCLSGLYPFQVNYSVYEDHQCRVIFVNALVTICRFSFRLRQRNRWFL